MCYAVRAIVGVILDVLRFGALFFRSSESIRAENLVLRKQIASFIERGIKPRRVDHATRVSLALFTGLFDWRETVVNVRTATIIRWHRLGWRIVWRMKCMAGRPPIPWCPETRTTSAVDSGDGFRTATGDLRTYGRIRLGPPPSVDRHRVPSSRESDAEGATSW
jgi:hypothetical protein